MVRRYIVAFGGQSSTHSIDIFAANTVDNAGFTLMPVEHSTDLFHYVRASPHFINKIRSVKRTYQHFRIFQVQLLSDIVANLLSGRGCVRTNCYITEDFL